MSIATSATANNPFPAPWPLLPCHTARPNGECSCDRIRCSSIGKHPRNPGGVQRASTDAAQLAAWRAQWPDANWAVATGAASGLLVLDIDPRHGGPESLEALQLTHGALPRTWRVRTGGGGLHYYFRCPIPAPGNSAGRVGPGLDIRGEGGYVLLPGALHASGRRYAWDTGASPADLPLAEPPSWLVALLATKPPRRQAPAAGTAIQEGQRDDTLFRMGCALRRQGCSEATINEALSRINAAQCVPPLTEAEVHRIAQSAASYAPAATAGAQEPEQPQEPEAPASLPDSDYTNALTLQAVYGDSLHYCHAWAKWLVWTGTHWESEQPSTVHQWAAETIEQLYAALPHIPSASARKKRFAHLQKSLGDHRLRAMVRRCADLDGIAVTPDALDTHPWLFNCTNGTLDLRTGLLAPPNPTQLLTHCLPALYDPHASCPRWMQFLEEIFAGSAALIAFVHRAVGYALTGDTSEQCLFLLHGEGANGKSTFLNVLATLLGPYARSTPSATVLSHAIGAPDALTNDLARLKGARLVTAVELGTQRRLNEELVKRLTGSDVITARFLYGEFFDFRPEFKLWLACNHLPQIRNTDEAVWRRIHRIPFTVQFAPDQQNKALPALLHAERFGILAWAVRGCLAWQREGLCPPPAVTQATAAYRADMDALAHFLDECVTILPDPRVTVRATRLYQRYCAWLKNGGVDSYPLTAREFTAQLDARGFHRAQRHANQYYWLGLGLRSETDSER